jgi:hypothetical protein
MQKDCEQVLYTDEQIVVYKQMVDGTETCTHMSSENWLLLPAHFLFRSISKHGSHYPLECEVVLNKSLARFATKQKKDFDRYLLHHIFHILIEVPAGT